MVGGRVEWVGWASEREVGLVSERAAGLVSEMARRGREMSTTGETKALSRLCRPGK